MPIILAFPNFEDLAAKLSEKTGYELGDVTVRHFPDGESYVKVISDVKDKDVIIICGLEHPDEKAMALMFLSQVLIELSAKTIGLVAPYLGYMRQDKRFHEGEAVTSEQFAKFISQHFDWLVTVDPHLHRHAKMSEIYSIPTRVLHAAESISSWIKEKIKHPVLIGPDEESMQWVKEVAKMADAPFTVLSKVRRGDTDVEVSIPEVDAYKKHTPILVDDIISTAHTMAETVTHLNNLEMKAPICIGVHGVFAGDALDVLKEAGANRIVTCNTIKHHTNEIDLSDIYVSAIKELIH